MNVRRSASCLKVNNIKQTTITSFVVCLVEHGPRDFFADASAKDPEFQLRIAKEGGFSGIVFQIGLAEKYMQRYAGEVPLVLKLNGKTEIPSDETPISPCMACLSRFL